MDGTTLTAGLSGLSWATYFLTLEVGYQEPRPSAFIEDLTL